MPLNRQSPTILHVLQNFSLILLALFFLPLCTAVSILSCIVSPFTATTKHITQHRKWRASSSATFQPRTILVTGVGMSKGLAIARSFYRCGHHVIGADFEPYNIPICGRFSVALDKFYRLSKPSSSGGGSRNYVDCLVEIVKKEKVELWVSCSNVACAIEDGEAKEAVEKLTNCKAVQFDSVTTKILHEKHSFIEHTQNLGLNAPETYLVTSIESASERMFSALAKTKQRHIMKSVGLDDTARTDMAILPLNTTAETMAYLERLNPSKSRPFVLQRFISGPEYCTHSLIVKGRVLAFTACCSAELLMHYRSLPPSSMLSQALLKYTKLYASKTGSSMTGHLSIDFVLDEDADPEEDIMQRVYPIECNPRAHTAVVLFADRSVEMTEAYLSILSDHSAPALPSDKLENAGITVPYTPVRFCWIGHDLVTLIILPFWAFTCRKIDVRRFLASWMEFQEHILFWKDGTFEVWDPWPAWWLYCVYWPGMFTVAIWKRRWWSRCNVSTTKMFAC